MHLDRKAKLESVLKINLSLLLFGQTKLTPSKVLDHSPSNVVFGSFGIVTHFIRITNFIGLITFSSFRQNRPCTINSFRQFRLFFDFNHFGNSVFGNSH